MKLKIGITSLVFLLIGNITSWAQDDLLKELDTVENPKKEIEMAAFKSLQICNMQSTKLAVKNEWYFVVSHRFGDLTQGFNNFFGLDNALTKIGGIYGVSNWLNIGVSRHTYNKNYELAVKYKLANQEINGFPVTIVGYNTFDVNTKLEKEEYPLLKDSQRLSYLTQLLISRKFSDSFSLELSPVYIHKNLYDKEIENKNELLIAIGGRYKLTKRISVNAEYATRINAKNSNTFHNPLSTGIDIETGGHVFQMVFSNSQPMNDVAYFSNSVGKWFEGPFYFGFNMYRVF